MVIRLPEKVTREIYRKYVMTYGYTQEEAEKVLRGLKWENDTDVRSPEELYGRMLEFLRN